MSADPLAELRAIDAERKSALRPKCLVCRMSSEELEVIHKGREQGYSFYTLAEYATRRGHTFRSGSVAGHFRNNHHVTKD